MHIDRDTASLFSGHGSAGRARPRHGRGPGFETRCPLQFHDGCARAHGRAKAPISTGGGRDVRCRTSIVRHRAARALGGQPHSRRSTTVMTLVSLSRRVRLGDQGTGLSLRRRGFALLREQQDAAQLRAEGQRRSLCNPARDARFHGGVAQLGEQLPCTQPVAGSMPVTSTTFQSR